MPSIFKQIKFQIVVTQIELHAQGPCTSGKKVSIHLIEKYLFKSQKVNQQLTRQFQKMDLQACTFNAN